jgi:EmrB/QacA subfamily drug resistance transporter
MSRPMPDRKWWPLAIVVLAIFMLLVDITIVNVALPDIARSLDASFTDLQWVIDAYALALATFVLNAGATADLLGRRKVFLGGLVIFTGASITCGLATTPLFLIAARSVQGVGGAIMFATSLALLAESYSGRDRGVAFGVWGATAGAAVAIGPLVGGILTSGLGWEWIFWVNGPIGLLAFAGALRRLPESRDPEAARPDWPGLVTFAGGISMVVYALLRGEDQGWTTGLVIGLFAGGAILLGLFVLVQAREERPMVDLALFRRPAFVGAQTTAFLLSASWFGLFLYLTLYLQNVLGYSALGAGLRLLPVSAASFVVAPIAGRLSASVPVRILMGVGLGLIGVALLLMEGLSARSHWTALLAGFVVGGIGVGLTNPPLASTAVSVVPRERSGMASGINNTFRQVGIATGVAALGAIFQTQVRDHLASALQGTPGSAHLSQLARAASSGAVAQALPHVPPGARRQIVQASNAAFVSGLDRIFWIAAALAFAGAVLAAVLVRSSDISHHGGGAREPAERREQQPAGVG